DPAEPRRRREVRRVLRPRPCGTPAGRPRDHREYVSGVRGDVRLLPGRRGDLALPAPDRPQRGAGRARRGLLPRAGPLPRPPPPAGVLGGGRARPRRRRAEPRRTAPPAGPGAADRGEGVLSGV